MCVCVQRDGREGRSSVPGFRAILILVAYSAYLRLSKKKQNLNSNSERAVMSVKTQTPKGFVVTAGIADCQVMGADQTGFG